MKPRLIILIVAAAGLAVYFAVAKSTPKTGTGSELDTTVDTGTSSAELAEIREMQTMLDQFPLAGDEPTDPPDIHADVRVDTSTGKNRLYVTLSESHGYYVEQFRVQIWYKDDADTEYEDAALSVEHFVDRYVKANETLTDCLEIVPAELGRIGGDMGNSDQWAARVAGHGRARASNPAELRARQPSRCAG